MFVSGSNGLNLGNLDLLGWAICHSYLYVVTREGKLCMCTNRIMPTQVEPNGPNQMLYNKSIMLVFQEYNFNFSKIFMIIIHKLNQTPANF